MFILLFAGRGSAQSIQAREGPPQAETVVARVGHETITQHALMRELERRHMSPKPGQEVVRRVLDELIEEKLILARVYEAGFDQHPEMVREVQRLLVDHYKIHHLQPLLEQVRVSDQEIRDAYEGARERYMRPARIRAQVIDFHLPKQASERKREALEQRMREVHASALEQKDDQVGYARLVARTSDDQATRSRGGDRGWLTRAQCREIWGDAVAEALFDMARPGEVTEPMLTDTGWVIARLHAVQPENIQPLEQVASQIRDRLETEKRDRLVREFHDALRARARVTVDASQLTSFQPRPSTKDSSTTPPSMPGVRTQRPQDAKKEK